MWSELVFFNIIVDHGTPVCVVHPPTKGAIWRSKPWDEREWDNEEEEEVINDMVQQLEDLNNLLEKLKKNPKFRNSDSWPHLN